MTKLLIVMPVHNEASNLKRFLPQLKQEASSVSADILAINDASTDNSLDVLTRHGIETITHLTQMGYGSTIQTGYKYALRNGYDYVIQLDGDAQHDPRFIPILLSELREGTGDILIGSRFLPQDQIPFPPQGELYYGTPVRRIGIFMFRIVLKILTFYRISDPTSGYVGFNRSALKFVSGKSFPFDYPDADMILTYLRNGFRIREVPVYMYQPTEASKMHRGCKPIWYVIKVYLALLIAFIRRQETPGGDKYGFKELQS